MSLIQRMEPFFRIRLQQSPRHCIMSVEYLYECNISTQLDFLQASFTLVEFLKQRTIKYTVFPHSNMKDLTVKANHFQTFKLIKMC